MYLQITTKCNMRCPHCAFSCTSRGQHMEMLTVLNAIRWLDPGVVTLGGGEPMMHPRFQDIVTHFINLGARNCESISVITNGSRPRNAWWFIEQMDLLSRPGRGSVLSLYMSDPRDGLHNYELVDPGLLAYCDRNKLLWRSPSAYRQKTIVRQGRAATEHGRMEIANSVRDKIVDNVDGGNCLCADVFVRPNGDVHACACADAPVIGNVNTCGGPMAIPCGGGCWKSNDADGYAEREAADITDLINNLKEEPQPAYSL